MEYEYDARNRLDEWMLDTVGKDYDYDRVAYGSEGWTRFFQSAGLRRPCQTAKTTIWSSSTQ
jgi:hypothetical protein